MNKYENTEKSATYQKSPAFEKIKMCFRSLIPLLIAQLTICIWMNSDLLESSAAVPALYVLGILSGVSAGKYFFRDE